jgi:hypothetical protein
MIAPAYYQPDPAVLRFFATRSPMGGGARMA